jgi:hypothetical protein
MRLKVFLKLKKTLKPSLPGKKNQKKPKKNPKNPKKPKKNQKNPLGWFFFKPRFFPTLIFTHPRSRIPDLGSRISDPGSRIPDLGSRIQKQQQKTGVKKNFLSNHFL